MHARHCAMRRAALLCEELAANVGYGIALQRNSRVATLLRTVVHQPVFADIQIARACTASPVVGSAVRDVFLEPVEARIMFLFHLLHFEIDFALFVSQRAQLSVAVLNDPHGQSESQLYCS